MSARARAALRSVESEKRRERESEREREREREREDKAAGFAKSRAPATRGPRKDRFPVRYGKDGPTQTGVPQVGTGLLARRLV